jgi:glycosyltransferase involved in cell wall biosynthesis
LCLFDKVIVINKEELRRFKFLSKEKIVLLPHGVPSYFLSKFSRFRSKQKRKVLLFVGRVHPSKGIDFLINACSLIKNYKKITINVVGPIEDRKYYRQLKLKIDNYGLDVRFLGEKKREELPNLYDNGDILILPSPYEAFGIVILEAFARGKPVIAVDSDGPRFLIENGENGFLVKYGDIKSLANYIEILLKNKKLYRKISKNNKNKAKQFTWGKIVKNLIKVYEEALGNNHSI